MYPESLQRLIRHLSLLPGIGQKSATRLALYLIRDNRELAETLARDLIEVKEKVRFCKICFNISEQELCDICSDETRDIRLICVVEGPAEQAAIEESGAYKGRYHILHGTLSPLNGIGPDDIKIKELLERIEAGGVKEVILATNPTAQGEATAIYIAKLIIDKYPDIDITRIALGLPFGSDLKYADLMTLEKAITNRSPISL
ncbi:MAG: recombination protein RecR [Deltaproteobacteria bacterium]|nr:MAG: recombination protein RecR [Deltaproteobacteria bacterium]